MRIGLEDGAGNGFTCDLQRGSELLRVEVLGSEVGVEALAIETMA